jgi:hypothetical protein
MSLTREQARKVLDLPMDSKYNDIGARSVRKYLTRLLQQVWMDQEGFSGKRPFGNSGWTYDLLKPLAAANMIGGVGIEIDEDGYVEVIYAPGIDYRDADTLLFVIIRDAIDEMGRPA